MRLVFLYVIHLFAIVAGPLPVWYSLKVITYTAAIMGVVCGIGYVIGRAEEENAAEPPEIAQEPILPPAPTPTERQPDRPVKVDEETHAVTWPDATITTTPEEREPYLGQIF